MTFKSGGELVFKRGLELLMPAQWAYNPARQELRLTVRTVEEDDLMRFEYHVKTGGIKTVDTEKGSIYYQFDENTTSLNVTGWIYRKE